jgi:catechol 2,3-dioxygenase-like lactoylglutathione lyase family enzyme
MATSRLQLALNVSNIDEATRFYQDLFGVPAAKQRPGYANFEVADPPLKLVLFENPGATPLNHLGVELASSEDVLATGTRFESLGLTHSLSTSDRCCHAVQDKVWVDAPDVPLGGWEFYTVLADDSTGAESSSPASVCCGDSRDTASTCCAPAGDEG